MIMSAASAVKFISTDSFSSFSPILPKPSPISTAFSSKFYHCSHSIYRDSRKFLTLVSSKSSEAEEQLSSPEDEWLKKLPEKKKPLYSHSLPSIEAWLRSLGFYQSKEDRAVWFAEKVEWHAQLSLDVTDLYIRDNQVSTVKMYFDLKVSEERARKPRERCRAEIQLCIEQRRH